jgi:molybdopterin synthase catalytic subunit
LASRGAQIPRRVDQLGGSIDVEAIPRRWTLSSTARADQARAAGVLAITDGVVHAVLVIKHRDGFDAYYAQVDKMKDRLAALKKADGAAS